MTKQCTKCGEVKPLDAFGKDKSCSGGRRPDCRLCRSRQEHARIAANRAKYDAYQAAYRAAHREKQRRYAAEYHKANPHVSWVNCYRRRLRRYGYLPIVEDFTREDVIARYGDACAHCGGPFEELDHYPIPVSEGGPHTLANVRPSCAKCNRLTWQPPRTPERSTDR